nr:unnamed protein product [Callosobruchus chinensis]
MVLEELSGVARNQETEDEQDDLRIKDYRKPVVPCFCEFLHKRGCSCYFSLVVCLNASDLEKHTELINLLNEQGLDKSDVDLIKNLYWEQTASIRLEDKLTTNIPIRIGHFWLMVGMFTAKGDRILRSEKKLYISNIDKGSMVTSGGHECTK